ncbi:MAG: ABC-2 family transporter protein [Elusimicrobia bacterium]|nr:ABC-2 family transporter protein [Elusimicrobiota bacterium]
MKTLRRYGRIWFRLAQMSFAEVWATRINSLGWLLGKLVRLIFFFMFIVAIFRHTNSLRGYTLPEAALFFLTFNLVDLMAQLFFRGIYGIRRIVVEGELDYYLLHPANPLFRIACQTVDILDFLTAVPVIVLTFWAMGHLPAEALGADRLALYLLLVAGGVAIAFAIHVCVAAVAVATQQLENTIWLYRDLMILGRFPSDIYTEGMRFFLTFVIPVAVMTSFPAKALLGLLSWPWVVFAVFLAAGSVAASLRLWQFCLARYTSVSS